MAMLRLEREGKLPYYVGQPEASASLGFLRWWRAIPRLKRTLIVMLLICTLVFFFFVRQLPHETDAIQEQIAPKAPAAHIPDPDDTVINRAKNPTIPSPPESRIPRFTGPQNEKQRAVVEAFQHAWKNYKAYAWGHDQLKPLSQSYSEWFHIGLTIVDSVDTAIIMNLTEEAKEAREWIAQAHFDSNEFVNFFETTIRVLGGLLSAHHLTGDDMYREKAELVGSKLLNAFTKSPSAVPFSDVNLNTGSAKSPQWSTESSLSEVTTVQLEFRDLSRITNNKTYEETAFKVSQHIHDIGCAKHEGLCDMFISSTTGQFKAGTTITFGARADSYYEYLLKQWLQTGKSIDWLVDDYKQAMTSMESKLFRYSEPSKFGFVGELLGGSTYSPKMDHLVCFLAGTLALGSQNGLDKHHLELGESLAKACYAMYKNPSGLGPEIAYYNMVPGVSEDLTIKPLDAHSLLRPEAIEAWFYLYRITGKKEYQDYGWTAFQAIEKHARLKTGYSSVNNVKKLPVTYRDMMESFFLAETLKYLYLLFADDQEILPLDKWVFNTEAHPLPIYSN